MLRLRTRPDPCSLATVFPLHDRRRPSCRRRLPPRVLAGLRQGQSSGFHRRRRCRERRARYIHSIAFGAGVYHSVGRRIVNVPGCAGDALAFVAVKVVGRDVYVVGGGAAAGAAGSVRRAGAAKSHS